MDGDDQEGLLHVAWNDGRAKIAARQHAGARIHNQSALGDALLLRVTLVTTLGKDWTDVLLEEFQTGGIHLRFHGRIGSLKHGDRPQGGQQRKEAEHVLGAIHGFRRIENR